jgi:hypothetical protein
VSIFGRLVSPWDIEVAVLTTLRTWMPSYLGEISRQQAPLQTRLPAPGSYVGSPDLEAWAQEDNPCVIVVVNPEGDPERTSDGIFQTYRAQVAVVILDDDPDQARMMASFYGAAVMGAITQRGSLGGIATGTVLTGAPTLSLPDEDERGIYLCLTTFAVTVCPIVQPSAGPAVPTPPDSPEYGGNPDMPWGDFPTVQTTDLTVTGEPIEYQEDE